MTRAILTTSVSCRGVMGLPSDSKKAGEFLLAGTMDAYRSQAEAGQAGDPGILGRDRTAGLAPILIVFDDLSTTMRPEVVDVMSPLVRVWGPDQRVADGVNKLEARRKAKKPTHRAAMIGTACVTPWKY